MPAPAAALLARQDIEVERVPVWQPLVADPAAKPAKPPRGGGGSGPSAQVPYGIQVMYDGTLSGGGTPSGGSGIKVAIIDTGAYTGHPDVTASGRWFACKDYTTLRSGFENNTCTDSNSHGTHVAGTIGAHGGPLDKGIYGVAPGVSLGAYKVCGKQGCDSDDIAAAIYQARTDGAHIISMSLGGDAADRYTRPAVVAVASLYQFVAGTDYSAANLVVNSWSSRGIDDGVDAGISEREVELAAPGFQVESTWKDGGYNIISGTSIATPHVSGLAARLWADNPDKTAAQIQAMLITNARDITRYNMGTGVITTQTGTRKYDRHSGYGNPRIR